MNKIERAVISVSDKTNLVDFVRKLTSFNIEILSTGGTAKILMDNNISVKKIEDYTGFQEIFDGRVKTLHPKIFGGILFIREDEKHKEEAKRNGILPIDLVVVDLYPFEKVINSKNFSFQDAIENIDIGGVSLIRAAAKNHKYVSILCSPNDYDDFILHLEKNNGYVSEEYNLSLAVKAFSVCSRYDSIIYSWLLEQENKTIFPQILPLSLSLVKELRYGENPHQRAAFYSFSKKRLLSNIEQLQGKELSFNNMLDLNTVFEMIYAINNNFNSAACVILKHNNPCGVALAESISEAFKRAKDADPVSMFGGIIGFNLPVDGNTAKDISEYFFEVIYAPDFSEDAINILSNKKNLRLVKIPVDPDDFKYNRLDYKTIRGGILVQETDDLYEKDWKVVTKKQPSQDTLEELKFALLVCRFVKSNAIVISKNFQTIGIGAGQMSRIDSVKIACEKAKNFGFSLEKSVLSSDAFFPFPDGVEYAAERGVDAVVQPGGSIKDKEVIEACDRLGVSMVITGVRHFRH